MQRTVVIEKTDSNSLRLLGERRFLPFFLTQFLGAFNDNVFKNAMLLLVTFQLVSAAHTNLVVNLSAALFILPFFLFSAAAGQLSECGEKSSYMQRVKILEIFIMLIGTVAFFLRNVPLLMFTLFMMGTQSAFFGPAKYSILPQQLRRTELISGNALVEAGTFLAILFGTLVGGILVALPGASETRISATILTIALLGYLASRKIPPTPVSAPDLKVNWNPVAETRAILNYIGKRRALLFPVIGISWFWFFGALFLTQLPNYTRTVLGGNGAVATVLLSAFSLGIGIGSFLCEKLCARKIRLSLIPIGGAGLSLFAVDLSFLNLPPVSSELLGAAEFLSLPGNWRVPVDMLLMSLCGGVYIVPLYTITQSRCPDRHRSRVIAGNNIINAAFMVTAALFAITLLQSGLSIPQLFTVTAGVNALVLIYLCTGVFEGDDDDGDGADGDGAGVAADGRAVRNTVPAARAFNETDS